MCKQIYERRLIAPLVVAFCVLFASPAANGQSGECGPDACASGTVPIVDADGDFAGWCASINQPSNAEILVTDVVFDDPNFGDYVICECNLNFRSPPTPNGIITPILIDFLQICDDAQTIDQIRIRSSCISNQTGVDWGMFDFILLGSDRAWYDYYSGFFSVQPFTVLSGRQFIDPPENSRFTKLTAVGAILHDGEAITSQQSTLRIYTDLMWERPLSFTLKMRPRMAQPCTLISTVPDGDVESLITAINCANATPGPDTIDLATDGHYVFTQTENFTFGRNALPPITSEITINGNGAVLERSSAEEFRIIEAELDAVLTLNDMEIRNGAVHGSGSSGSGAGLLNGHGFVTLSGVHVRNNATTTTAGFGGAGICNFGTLVLLDSVVSENMATSDGGGIVNYEGTMIAQNSVIDHNTAVFGSGAGVVNRPDGMMTLDATTVSDNSGIRSGGILNSGHGNLVGQCDVRGNSGGGSNGSVGGIYNDGDLSIENSRVAENHSLDTGTGGILNIASLSISDSTIEQNNGYFGGLLNYGGGVATIARSVIAENVAYEGGGIDNNIDGTLDISESTIRDNIAEGIGGGIHSYGVVDISHCTIAGNLSHGGSGGFANSGMGVVRMNSTTVVGNQAGTAGGLGSRGTAIINDSTFTGNMADNYGAGLYNVYGTLMLTNCTVSDNETAAKGGGVFNWLDGTVTMIHCTLSGNRSTGSGIRGGGVCNRAILELQNSIIANSQGGDCYNPDGTVFDNGYNIIEDGSCITSATSIGGDPMLGPLADNGGPTLTHALLPGSPAIDMGDCAGGTVLFDQRGVARPQGAACDIGAFELEQALLGDFDADGDVDLSDFAQFSLCFNGANQPPAAACPQGVNADCDADGDVDLSDFAAISLAFTGAR